MRDPASSCADGLCPPQSFERLIGRERERSERCGSPIAVLRLHLPAHVEGAELLGVVAVILRRIRATDELGWLTAGVLGLLLPETGGQGAWILAADLRRRDRTGLLDASIFELRTWAPSADSSDPLGRTPRGLVMPA